LPVSLPEGIAFDTITGVPQTATPAPLLIAVGVLMLLLGSGVHVARLRGRRVAPAQIRRVDALVAAARRVC
jgi:hypothetical protein